MAMANEEHVAILRQGVEAWNTWRQENQKIIPDLSSTDLRGKDLRRVNFARTDLHAAILARANLSEGILIMANLRMANLIEADLHGTDLIEADLHRANLRKAFLARSILSGAKLVRANLRGAFLRHALLVETDFSEADLTGCHVYGISAWDLTLHGAKQHDLVITNVGQPVITADNIEVAQFIYLLLHSDKIRHAIDSITSKVVLILGRFTPERKAVLDALRDELRKHDYLPVLFDFEKPAGQTVTETVSLLARMARFVVADITDAKSVPQELSVIVPDLPSVPVQPLLLEGSGEYGMFEHFRRYPWVLPIHVYPSPEQLIANLSDRVIAPAEAKVRELRALGGA
jgi:hypothetical protein